MMVTIMATMMVVVADTMATHATMLAQYLAMHASQWLDSVEHHPTPGCCVLLECD